MYQYQGIYADEKSGLVEKARDGFQQMKRDAKAGKFSLIFCKSVSRFSRNAEEFMSTIRELRAAGVTVFFEEENKSTQDSANDFMLALRVTIAQEESRNISVNVSWGLRRRMENGQVFLAYSQFLGYESDGNGSLRIVEKEAVIVRKIYYLFLHGWTYGMIAEYLTENGCPTPKGKKVWSVSTIVSILKNEKYKGCLVLGKTHVKDYLTKKTVQNTGYAPRYEYSNTHPPIISPEIHSVVQADIARRKESGRLQRRSNVFSRKVVCGCCGAYFGPKMWHANSKYKRTVYQCNDKYKQSTPCTSPHTTEEKLQAEFLDALGQIIESKAKLIPGLEKRLSDLLDNKCLDREQQTLVQRRNDLYKQVTQLVEKNARVTDNHQKFIDEYNALTSAFDSVQKDISAVREKIDERLVEAGMIRLLLEDIADINEPLTDFDNELWYSTIDRLVVDATGAITVRFRCGIDITV